MARHLLRVREGKVLKHYLNKGSFIREHKALKCLKPHPFVTELIDSFHYFEDEKFTGVCTFKFYKGCDLLTWMECHPNGSNIKFVRYVMKKILLAYDYASKFSIYHRDVKPENVMIDEHGIVKLIDWELCSFERFSKRRVGTLEYMAEEVFRAKVYECSKSDIWSMGTVLFCLATGARPYSRFTSDATYSLYGNSDECITAIYKSNWKAFWRSFEKTDAFPLLPYDLKDCIQRMLKKDPNARSNVESTMFHDFFCGKEYTPRDVVQQMKLSITKKSFLQKTPSTK
jgi:serine/threonine protein kinase